MLHRCGMPLGLAAWSGLLIVAMTVCGGCATLAPGPFRGTRMPAKQKEGPPLASVRIDLAHDSVEFQTLRMQKRAELTPDEASGLRTAIDGLGSLSGGRDGGSPARRSALDRISIAGDAETRAWWVYFPVGAAPDRDPPPPRQAQVMCNVCAQRPDDLPQPKVQAVHVALHRIMTRLMKQYAGLDATRGIPPRDGNRVPTRYSYFVQQAPSVRERTTNASSR